MKQATTLAECLQWLEQLHPTEIELGLGRVATVAARLKLLKPQSTVVTFAGTNGKGSAVAMTEAALLQLGFTVGCYTSPHIFDFNERIRINGENSADQLIIDAFQAIEVARGDVSLTYFEYATLAALLIFAEQGLDYVLLEVGLGGRLDAVNMIDADVAVVTSIALDHQDWLGSDLDVIAQEKLGVARKDKPLLITELSPPPAMALSACETGAKIYWLGQDFSVEQLEADQLAVKLQTLSLQVPAPVNLSIESYVTALQLLEILRLPVQQVDFTALAATALYGRFHQVALGDNELIFDVAHNPAAVQRLVSRLQTLAEKPTSIVLAMMADKDCEQLIDILSSCSIECWYLPNLGIPRAMQPDQLETLIRRKLPNAKIRTATIQASLAELNCNQRLLICGSFYTVSAGLAAIKTEG